MTDTITISKHQYKELMEKARMLESIVDEEGLTEAELRKLRKAERSRTLTEKEARKRHGWFFK